MSRYKDIISARAFLEDPLFEAIVKCCNLYPIKNWKEWQDERGNALRILDNKDIKIIKTKSEISKTNDIFFKSNPSLTITHSKWLLCMANNKESVVLLLGNDNRLRMSYFVENKWTKNLSPLVAGINTLRAIAFGYIKGTPIKISDVLPTFIIPDLVFSTNCPVDESLKGKLPCELMIK